MTKTAFIAIVGCPNVGKSSILNRLLGQKIAIVSEKPQTTRTRITGIMTDGDIQLVFTDTPGFHRPKTKLGENMVKAVTDSIADVDACLFVVEPSGELREKELELIERFKTERIPVILAINKVDTVSEKENIMLRIAQFDFSAVVPVSARTGNNFNALKKELEALAQESVHFFPEDTLTDQPERVLMAEIVREKMLRLLDKEIPHGTAVGIERMREREGRDDLIDIEAIIYCEKESHKGIIIGKKGDMLKRISTRAREDMETFLCANVNLKCWVKVKEDWRNRQGLIRNFGLESGGIM